MSKAKKRENLWGYLFILPNFAGFALFTIVPVVIAFVLSLSNYDIISQFDFVGLRNYAKLFTDNRFLQAMKNTVYYCVLTVPTGIVLSFLVAVLLNRQIRGIRIVRTFVFIPVITSMVAIALVWSMLYEEQSGLLNIILEAVGLNKVGWLTDPDMAMISIAIMSVWKSLGYNMTIYLAGLQGVPADLYEAATIDGANSFQKMIRITIPMLQPTTYFITLTSLIGAFQVFDQVSVMTQGGPINSTTTIAMYLYNYGFKFFEMGYACSAAYILFVLVFGISMIQNYISKKNDVMREV